MSVNVSIASGTARCTVIIPARNAADTIVETIASVQAQTRPDWHAVVVDDRSTDTTASIVRGIAERDPRIRVVSGAALGPGAARNVGIRSAATPFISFLDADDLLASSFLEHMIDPLEADMAVAATYTGWLRLAPDGSTEQGPCPNVNGDLFDLFAAACVFPPHACMVRRSVILDVGGFDESPSTTEDWDLWQRLARTGARFVRIPGALVRYRMRVGSRSRNSQRVLDDGLAVIARGHAADPRVDSPAPSHQVGLDPERLPRNSYNHLSWAAGMAIASGEDPKPLLAALHYMTAPDLDPWEIGGTLLESMRVTLCAPQGMALATVGPHADGLLAFLWALERATQAPDLAERVARAVDQLVSQQDTSGRPRTLLTSHEATVDLARPLPEVTGLPSRISRFRADLTYESDPIGEIELPVIDGRVSPSQVADGAADAVCWPLLVKFLERTVLPTLDVQQTESGFVVRRHGIELGRGPVRDSGSGSPLFDVVGWTVFMEELFGTSGQPASDLFDQSPPAAAPTVHLDGGTLSVDASESLYDLRVDSESLTVQFTVGGAPLSQVVVAATDGGISAGRLRRSLADANTQELVRLAVREGIIGWPLWNGVRLYTRLAQRHARLQHIPD